MSCVHTVVDEMGVYQVAINHLISSKLSFVSNYLFASSDQTLCSSPLCLKSGAEVETTP